MLPFVIIAVAYLVLTPVEVAVSGPSSRRRRANLGMILPLALAAVLTDLAFVGVTSWADRHDLGLVPWLDLGFVPATIVTVLVADLTGYLGHRVRHRSGLLWRIHLTHHTDPDVDVTTLLRTHPLDVAAIGVVSSLTVLALGAPASAVAVSAALGAVFGVFIHARVRLPRRLELALAAVVQTPGLHRAHHSPDQSQTDSNYGLILSVWDRALGTYSSPDPTVETGLDTVDLGRRQTLRAMLADPWRPTVRGVAPRPADLRADDPAARSDRAA
jgi:sterol desaturase/sphingolipid hydroxylase (fatty acid hydroxylase superfamily)